jgi:methylated-DNA-[protein]-cysteine S-methyltransferase
MTTTTESTTETTTQTTIYWTVETPVGELLLAGDGEHLQRLHMQSGNRPATVEPGWERAEQPFAEMCEQLDQYFAGERREFDLPLAPRGSDFQRRVWAALEEIPYGETRTYGEIADSIGRPSASRAVGAANGANPISIVIPCHRVIGSSGALTGYAGGVERKRRLLELERAV